MSQPEAPGANCSPQCLNMGNPRQPSSLPLRGHHGTAPQVAAERVGIVGSADAPGEAYPRRPLVCIGTHAIRPRWALGVLVPSTMTRPLSFSTSCARLLYES